MATNVDTYQATNNNQNFTRGDGPLEKDYGNTNGGGKRTTPALSLEHTDALQGYHMDHNTDPEDALKRIRTTGSLSISPELFEKIYLSPQNRVAGELRKTFGNPTPL